MSESKNISSEATIIVEEKLPFDPEEKMEGLSKEDLLKRLKELVKVYSPASHSGYLKRLSEAYDDVFNAEKQEALNKFLDEGGEEDDFAFTPDKLSKDFSALGDKLSKQTRDYFKEQKAQQEDNYKKKKEVLDRLRELVDAEETNLSINQLKKIQEEWRSIGPVARNKDRELWPNFKALVYRFYNNRSVFFELKDLDRAKNKEAKEALCDKAEALAQEKDIFKAVKEARSLKDEFRYTGPAPKEEDDKLWERFKAALDVVYDKRREAFAELDKEREANLEKKQVILEKVKEGSIFESEEASVWKKKIQEMLKLQEEWKKIGQVPKNEAKAINKSFWSAYKQFFQQKNKFFKQLEGNRDENLEKKQAICKEVEEVINNEELGNSDKSNKLKALQQQWFDIGPVPNKHREALNKRFKGMLDDFFQGLRKEYDKLQKSYEDNLKKKQALCKQIEKLKELDKEQLDAYVKQWEEIGFVPKSDKNKIEKQFLQLLKAKAGEADVADTTVLKAELEVLKGGGKGSEKALQNKERELRNQIRKLEDESSTLRTNLDFFANSKTADKLKAEYEAKIEKADKEIAVLKKQLKAVRNTIR